MIYITRSKVLNFALESPSHCYLDIETTGLSKQHDTIVCMGIAFRKEDHFHSYHWLIENKEEEALLIETLFKELIKFQKVYTYGGKHFEWPFVLEKATQYGLSTSILTTLHLVDLKSSKRPRAAIETEIGFKRGLTTSGRELAKLCKLFLTSPSSSYSNLICEHNQEELLSLMTTYHFYKFLDHLQQAPLTGSAFEEDRLTFDLSPSFFYPYSFTYSVEPYRGCYDAASRHFVLCIPALLLKLKTYLPPNDYYIVEGTLMHKSLARLLPSSMKTKATKSTCYLEQEGLYLPLKLSNQSLLWVDENKQTYIPYDVEHLKGSIDELLKISTKKIAQRL